MSAMRNDDVGFLLMGLLPASVADDDDDDDDAV